MADLILPASPEFHTERTLTDDHDVREAVLYDMVGRANVHSFNPDEVFVTKKGFEWYLPLRTLYKTDRLKFEFVAIPAAQMREGLRLYVHGTRLDYHVNDHYEVVGGLAVFTSCPLPYGV